MIFEVEEEMWVWFLEKMMRLITMGLSKITISDYLLLRTRESFLDLDFPLDGKGCLWASVEFLSCLSRSKVGVSPFRSSLNFEALVCPRFYFLNPLLETKFINIFAFSGVVR